MSKTKKEESKDKYLFLDCDGVLNGNLWFRVHHDELLSNKNFTCEINPLSMLVLEEICRSVPNLKIIITSSWRMKQCQMDVLREAFDKHNIPLNGTTTLELKHFGLEYRNDEIKEYVDEHNIDIYDMVIVDDMSIDYFPSFTGRVHKTNVNDGLSYESYRNICKLFGAYPLKYI